MKITKNESKIDRILRIVGGVILLLVGIFANIGTTLAVILVILGAILLITGIVGFCPLYAIFKFSTKK